MSKPKILIVDDSEMNRDFLEDILYEQYEIVKVENGMQAVEILSEDETDFWLVLLDIMMPKMDGFAVLSYINKHYWNDRVVVMMISSDDSPDRINHAYGLGAFDYISRPFDPMIVRKRVANTMLLYERQHDLEEAMREQFYEQQENNDLMISILSHIVEFRNGESGLHIQNVKLITEHLLKQLVRVTDVYALSVTDIDLITMASAIHDVGKISIPEEILNKPGKLTAEEFEVMKTHAEISSKMLSELPSNQFATPLVKRAFEICRWHHERYDGKGYPDGLKGEEIPISAQVVALADVYDALTSERCYKKAIPHEEALTMILEGKCGIFNPILLECLEGISDKLEKLHLTADLGQETENAEDVKEYQDKKEKPKKTKQDLPFNRQGYMQLLYVDSLTNQYNRRYYQEYLQDVTDIEAIALIDVNNLSQINSNYGDEVGDLVLQYTARELFSLIRRNDYLIRYGGDEFLVVFSGMSGNAFGARLEHIKASFDKLTIEGYPQLNVSISVGGVYGLKKPAELFDTADQMLKQAKCIEKHVMVGFMDENEDSAEDKEQEEV